MKSFFIIGTDTSCGKTYVTCKLMQAIQAHNHSVRALKPVASGCDVVSGERINEDVVNILEVDKTKADVQDICGWLFKDPIAPHLAAADENVKLSAKDIVTFCQNKDLDCFTYTLIEGAGGLMVPLNSSENWLDVLDQLKIPVILIVGMRLGCINHALLTLLALKSRGIACVGWIANCIDPAMLRLQDNIQSLKTRLSVPLLATVANNGGIDTCPRIFLD